MKISRVTTLAFSISSQKEEKFEKELNSKACGRFLGIFKKREETDITKGYTPLGKFKVSRLEKITKGVLNGKEYESIENYFYVDLNTLELFYFDGNKRSVERFDIIQKVFPLSEKSIITLGNVLREGETLLEKLDYNVVQELLRAGLLTVFKPRLKELSAAVVDEMTPESGKTTLVKERVKIKFHIPHFDDANYNIMNFLSAEDKKAEEYTLQHIKYSLIKLSEVIKQLFQAENSIAAVIFMPFIECKYSTNEKTKTFERKFPTCRINEKTAKKEGEKITPLSLSTELDAPECVPSEHPTINFSDIVDMEIVKEEIRAEIIYPILQPEISKKFGKKAGGGILLYGPPGCGKTYIARATIGECDVSFFNVNLSDLVSKGAETAPKILHDIFERATKEAPSLIFIDEIDAIGGKRTAEEQHFARMLLDQLLMEIDGVESLKESILFIAATNAPWAIDPALRRTERFTKQIFVPPPNFATRVELFKKHTVNKDMDSSIKFDELAKMTEGYASSDIKAICDDASKAPWEEAVHGSPERKISQQDFLNAISQQESSLIPWFKIARREFEKSGELELFKEFSKFILKYSGGVDESKRPDMTFEDVGGLDDVKEEIRRRVIYPIRNPETAEKFKRETSGGILLYGPPGCGKTYLAKATVGECNAAFFNVRITDVISGEKGDPEKKIQEIFDRAERNAPAIIFIDEIDAIIGRRDLDKNEKRVLAQFLVEMDGFEQKKRVFVIAATNAPWAIDPALRRAGRFTTQLFVPQPNTKARAEIFKIHLEDKNLSKNVDIQKLAELTDGYASSDIKAICSMAADISWDEAVHGGTERKITQNDVINAISRQQSSLISWFKMAKKQIQDSDEKDIYKKLIEDINEFEKNHESADLKEELDREKVKLGVIGVTGKEKLKQLSIEKGDIEKMIAEARQRYYTRKIDEESFRRIIKDYEEKLIEINMKIKGLQGNQA